MTARNNTAAQAAFIAAKAEIDAMLMRLAALSADHFYVHSADVHYGHVGDISRMRDKLREITDAAFHEGEYAA